MPTLLRQSIYSGLAGYGDVNDAERLSVDPVMRAITGKKEKASKPPPREIYQNRSGGCQTQRIYYVSDGRGGDRQEVV